MNIFGASSLNLPRLVYAEAKPNKVLVNMRAKPSLVV